MYRPPSFLPPQQDAKLFNGRTRKSVFCSQETIRNAALKYGDKHILVATLTFPYPVTSRANAQKRLNSLLNEVRRMTVGYVWVLEYSQLRSIHFHLVLVVHDDIKTGTVLHELPKELYQTKAEMLRCCNPALRAFWNAFERVARKRGFGRIHISPVVKNVDAVAGYLTKQMYANWHMLARKDFERARLWGCSRNLICTSRKFHFVNSRWKNTVHEFLAVEGFSTVDEAVQTYGKHLESLIYQYARNSQSNTQEGVVQAPALAEADFGPQHNSNAYWAGPCSDKFWKTEVESPQRSEVTPPAQIERRLFTAHERESGFVPDALAEGKEAALSRKAEVPQGPMNMVPATAQSYQPVSSVGLGGNAAAESTPSELHHSPPGTTQHQPTQPLN